MFIHAERCDPYADSPAFPGDFHARRLILRAYGTDGQTVGAVVAEGGTAAERAGELLEAYDGCGHLLMRTRCWV